MCKRSVTLYRLLTCICLLHTGFATATSRARSNRSGHIKSFQAKRTSKERSNGVEAPAEAPAVGVNRSDTARSSATGRSQAASRADAEAVLVKWRVSAAPGSADTSQGIAKSIYITAPKTQRSNWILQGALETCGNFNPGYEIKLHDDADIQATIQRAAPGLLPLWGLLKPVERADLWRYVALYESGGWYMDSDVHCRLPFADWVDPAVDGEVNFVVGIEAAGWEGHYQPVQFCQWVFGAAPGHPILARAIDLVIYRFLSDRRWVNTSTYEPHPLRTTGPVVFSMAIEEFLDDRGVPLQQIANISAPVVVDGVKILEFPRVRGDVWSGHPELGWVTHQLAGTWKNGGSTSIER